MHKNSFLKTVVCIFALAVVLAIIITAIGSNLGAGAGEAVYNQTFFEQFVISGGPIVWFVLLPMSLVMVYLLAEYSFTIRRKRLLPKDIGAEIAGIIKQSGCTEPADEIAERDDLVSIAVVKALGQGRGDWFRMKNLLAESLQEQAMGLLRRIEWISLIGNVSPMVGLFGTVFGMIKLFNAIVTAGGQPQPAQLAGGISVALVTTFWGLFIAIPALAIHGVFRNRIETLVNDAVVETENIMPQIRSSIERQIRDKQTRQKQPIREIGKRAAEPIERPAVK